MTDSPAVDVVLNSEQIAGLLPHRYPFALVDRVVAHEPGVSAVAIKNITINEPVPEIEYVPSDLILTRGTTMTTLHPNVTGGAIASWEIEPMIPNGLVFVDGVISGTPIAIQNQTQ